MEAAGVAFGNLRPTPSRFGRDEKLPKFLGVLELEDLRVEVDLLGLQLAEEFNGRLGTKLFLFRHVHIIDEEDQSLVLRGQHDNFSVFTLGKQLGV